ncbi:SagB/ThcOx family dehydrogenase [uncultured Desulfosarcina sp.]|uniref:SagB/ThcOx family dehydrogenase n=1 Tax=uncultured Desulfosarcina sp. TaxID=218289 RepID=UPI0029C82560|nr:SagB/ThcOx family dehydrogenase [uncultured Desulfosarcina sp.]
MNDSASTAAGYHRATSYRRHRIPPHALDWANQPALVKDYSGLPRIPLPRNLELPRVDYFTRACRPEPECRTPDVAPNFNQIAAILQLSHGVTARAVHSGQPFYYRSVASAGALYPSELYLAAYESDGLHAGLYHYDPLGFSLTELRRQPLPAIPKVDRPVAASFYITGIFFRSAWKYRSRAYRYVLLDAGHLLENLRLALGALNQRFSIHLDFDDEQTANLLGLDPEREVCLACIHLHTDADKGLQPAASIELEPSGVDIRRASRVSGREASYSEILNLHRAGSGGGSVDSSSPMLVTHGQPLARIDLAPSDSPVAADYTQVLGRRRSRRNFISADVSRENFMTFAETMVQSMGARSGMPAACRSALAAGILASENMPVPPGFYLLDPKKRQLEQQLTGLLIQDMAAACLDQMWLKHAGLHLLFLTDPAFLDELWGARGYRYAMIEAGRLGQQAYLAATALGWGACGIGAIYDREAADLLGLTENGALVYLVGIGPVKTNVGKTR